ncbi:MAG: CshA/CshB family fibrillar adhesin-related protein [Clostridium sp.]|uniref:CshA/CshB family fibrillar adhesin-related protein n=1 Tax=Clostridium sp. TaxID=1506 RepID=UPI003EE437B9
MADLNGNAVFATTGSGTYADYIAWIDFTKELDFVTSGPLTVLNTIPGGYTVEFTVSGAPFPNNPINETSIWSAKPSQVPFGYLGKGTTYNLPTDPFFATGGKSFVFTLSNIIVKKNNIPITDYLFIVADAEITTSGETLNISSPTANWNILDLVPNHNPVESPIVTGVGSNTLKLTGVNYNTGTYLFQSYNVKDIVVSTPDLFPSGVVVAFGIVVTLPPPITKVANPPQVDNLPLNYVKFEASFTPTDSTILSYTLTDTLSETTGISYIPTTSLTTPKTTLTQNNIPITITETVTGTKVVYTINSTNLILNTPINISLVYRLDSILPINNIKNTISLLGETEAGPTPTLYADASVILNSVLKPKIVKTPNSQEVLIKDDERFSFTITISDLKYDLATQNYTILDKLDPNFTFDNANSNLSLTVGNIITPLPLNATVDSSNLLKVIIPANSIPSDGIITLKIAILLKNSSSITPLSTSLNTASLIIDENDSKTYNSNQVIVLFVTTCYKALSDVITSIALQEAALSHILNAEGEKIQKLLTLTNVTNTDILNVNTSVNAMVNSISMLELILGKKLILANPSCQKN